MFRKLVKSTWARKLLWQVEKWKKQRGHIFNLLTFALHSRACAASPIQPPVPASPSTQVRDRLRLPPPHVAEQLLQVSQSDQWEQDCKNSSTKCNDCLCPLQANVYCWLLALRILTNDLLCLVAVRRTKKEWMARNANKNSNSPKHISATVLAPISTK